MKKLLLSLSLIVAIITPTIGYAQNDEKVVSLTISSYSGSAQILDEYLLNQQYTGSIHGFQVEFGAMYKNNKNLSWDLYGRTYKADKADSELLSNVGLWNPARTSGVTLDAFSAGYGTYYNWTIGKKLQLKAGGLFDLYGGLKTGYPNSVNNAANFEGQAVVKASGGIKYGWDFKKWGLDIYANMSLPVFGIFIADHKSEAAMVGLVFKMMSGEGAFINKEFNHTFFGFYHNYQAIDFDMGIDFVFKPFSFGLSFIQNNKWWNANDVQNFRKYGMLSFNFGIDLVSRSKFKSSNKYF